MKEIIREFFGFGEQGYTREPEGYFSWQHLTFVTVLMLIMTALAIYFGLKNRHRDDRAKNKVIIWSAILIDGFELIKIVVACIDEQNPWEWVHLLPLFLCSIQLITIPLAAVSKGRVKEASLDFVFIFGLLGAVLGTYLAGQNYGCYPVLSFTNVVSGITHAISGFAALYIGISGMASMKVKNIPITYAILSCFAVAAYIANKLDGKNYMFLMQGDGTPYEILFRMVNGHPVLYPLGVVVLFLIYICVY
ncbi:MAG: YwaF family protein, partial [Clostridia bacterium]|nr:YwaF family protein [Clostridia bacterium]